MGCHGTRTKRSNHPRGYVLDGVYGRRENALAEAKRKRETRHYNAKVLPNTKSSPALGTKERYPWALFTKLKGPRLSR